MNINQLKNDTWVDEAGTEIPKQRITKLEKLKEKSSNSILGVAQKVSAALAELKAQVNSAHDTIIDEMSTENKVKIDSKGNFTWYNFNKTIKIETNVNDLIKFDEALLSTARDILTNIIDENLQGDDFVKSIVTDAFKTSKGKLDTKRIMGLKKHTSRIGNESIKTKWQKAMELIDSSISRPSSKKYTRVYLKNIDGAYDVIKLNFSDI
jgi:hypothetical protein